MHIDIYVLGRAGVANRLIVDAADEAGVTHVSKRACSRDVDCDLVTGGYNTDPGALTETRVVIAGGNNSASRVTKSRVKITGGGSERRKTERVVPAPATLLKRANVPNALLVSPSTLLDNA